MSTEEIKTKIADLRAEMAGCHGTQCEVYSRVVGYLRPVQNWNKGKKEEYILRKTIPLVEAKNRLP